MRTNTDADLALSDFNKDFKLTSGRKKSLLRPISSFGLSSNKSIKK